MALAFALSSLQAEDLPKIGGATTSDVNGVSVFPAGNGGAVLDPTALSQGPVVTAVPEPSTIAMFFVGGGCAGACVVFRRRRRG
jgi:hypothetical protein